MKHMRKAAAMMLAALTIASCSDNKFTVEVLRECRTGGHQRARLCETQ